ncbi:MAG TPA: MFS transporter [Saprospiraceae bacterium]|nr:MFS transporter [Saprospiraceae bacterium]MCC6688772.1 MFS transporter [Saprospiraceae bacterium]HMV24611.1 MFS transporter [Saprospiraceae bacterium]HMX85971.1 MFS transporter [Saprospiraceae bacterium]HMZ74123.1 MFS transporter [Saprospiraceae bacterium]
MNKTRIITKSVWILAFVSMFTDMASEMLYPVMPVYLQSVGFSVMLIGVLEGIAEALAGLSKAYFGRWSDVTGRRVPFVQVGYGLSAIAKPMMAILAVPLWIFVARTLDRLGKGIRTGARDAILTEQSTNATRGRIFGFHRSFDTVGAVIGPLMALAYLYYYPEDYRTLFLLAFIPGLLAIFASFRLKEGNTANGMQRKNTGFFSFIHYWKQSSAAYKKLVIGLLIFALINSSDMFLLLKAKQSGLSDTMVIGVYILYNLVFAISAYPLGILGDRIGLGRMFLLGVALFALVYLSIGFQTDVFVIVLLFLVYGIYIAATEGVSKAWISNFVGEKDVATAIGTYTGFQSIATMFSSSIAGVIWYSYGSEVTFTVAGLGAVAVFVYFCLKVKLDR